MDVLLTEQLCLPVLVPSRSLSPSSVRISAGVTRYPQPRAAATPTLLSFRPATTSTATSSKASLVTNSL